MQSIELETKIDENHELHLKLPENSRTGKAKVVVLFEDDGPDRDAPRVFGQFPGAVTMSDDFDEPLPDAFWLGGNP